MKRALLSKSSLMAVALASAVAIWMLTGIGGDASEPSTGSDRSEARSTSAGGAPSSMPFDALDAPADPGLRVAVEKSIAEPVVRDVVVSGRTEPNRIVEIKAETEGRVVEIGAERGVQVAEGERIVGLDVRDRDAQIAEAEALIAQRELQYEAAQRLQNQQLVSDVQIAEARAQLFSARAALERIRHDLTYTTIVAPFDGVLEDRAVELGDYVGIGDPVAQIVDNDPLIAVGEVNEREIVDLEVGSTGRAQFVNGEIFEGTVRYVSPVSDSSTRTFRIEIAIPNPENLPAGMTAEIRLPASEIEAHFLSPALLTLDDEGNIGVKTVDRNNKVRFYEVDIVRSASDGVWVTGLPDEVLIITVGQGFAAIGELVQPVRPTER